MNMNGVRGIMLDSSVVLLGNNNNNNCEGVENDAGRLSLRPGAEYLFQKLHHSNIPTGISYGPGLSSPETELPLSHLCKSLIVSIWDGIISDGPDFISHCKRFNVSTLSCPESIPTVVIEPAVGNQEQPSDSQDLKVGFLERMASLYSFRCFIVNPSSIDDTVNEVALSWSDNGGSFLHVVSNHNEDFSLKLQDHGWTIVILNVEGGGARENSRVILIDKLEEVPSIICHLNRKPEGMPCNSGSSSRCVMLLIQVLVAMYEAAGKDNVMVGYIMKPSREEDFAKRGAFPLYPTENGLIFVPLTFELSIRSQLQKVDVVLHKATDEIISVELSSSSDFSSKVVYTSGMQELQRCIEQQPDCCVIDPFISIYPVLDRLKIQQILLSLVNLNKEGGSRIRGPHFLKVDNFNEPNLAERLLEAKLYPPSIVKPQVACGVADAHSMAIVFRVDDYMDLNVPLPAIVQEYVDHSSTLFKFYVLGDKVFYAVKKSTPNANILTKLSERNGLKPLLFDSLKSLPTAQDGQKESDEHVDVGLVTDAASWLRKMLDLTIFGFDVVIQEGSGDHVIVDVNYLPSFKEVADDVAIPAFWEAIKIKYDNHHSTTATTNTIKHH
ncbi:hypothetical protein LguiB_012387 [Lonicera macranthoides]